MSPRFSQETRRNFVACPGCGAKRPPQTIRTNLTCDECEISTLRKSAIPHRKDWNDVLAQRDSLLRQSDWVMLPDVEARLGAEKFAEWRDYRESLFDIREIFANPWEVVFPEQPT